MTNDGRMTNYLTHPKYEHEKEYVVEVFGPITDRQLGAMSEGMLLMKQDGYIKALNGVTTIEEVVRVAQI